jgi:hypothetical protein
MPASPYLTVKATMLPETCRDHQEMFGNVDSRKCRTWTAIRVCVSRFSFIGPNRTRRKFRIVRFVASRIFPVFGCVVTFVRPKVAKTRRIKAESFEGGWMKIAIDG